MWSIDKSLPIFIYEFGNTAFVIKNGTEVTAYLWGFLSQAQPTAYVHLLAVRVPYRRQGLARQLYDHFCTYVKAHGCTQCKAITTPTNKESIAFHRALGFELTGKPNRDGIPVVEDYSGPGQDRVVFQKVLKLREVKKWQKVGNRQRLRKLIGKVARLTDLVDYRDDSVVSREIINKKTGTVTLFAFDEGQGLSEHTAPFDALVYIFDGEVDITISGKTLHLKEGEMVIMPANQPHALKAVRRFKMILTMIRS